MDTAASLPETLPETLPENVSAEYVYSADLNMGHKYACDADSTQYLSASTEPGGFTPVSESSGIMSESITDRAHPECSNKKKATQKKFRMFYTVEVTDIPSTIAAINKFITLHPEYFKININKKMIQIGNGQIYNIYTEPLFFKDPIHKVSGFMITDYDGKNYTIKIHINRTNKNKDCYVKQIENYVGRQTKYGNNVELYYYKILSDSIVKHEFYNEPIEKWQKDIVVLQNEFFSQNKSYLFSIINDKACNGGVGNTVNSWNNLILHGLPGSGKCHGFDTPILMFDGTIKMVQNIKVGDLLMGDDSTPRTVLTLASGVDNMYEVQHAGGASYTVNSQHILSLMSRFEDIYDMTVDEYMSIKNQRYMYGYSNCIEFYDITSKSNSISPDMSQTALPKDYKFSSVEQRLYFLFNFLDQMGMALIREPSVREDIIFICNSLALKYTIKNDILHVYEWKQICSTPFDRYDRPPLLEEIKITHIGTGEYYGFQLDGNSRYVLGNFIVTHNSSFIYRTAMLLKLSILSIDLSLYLNKKKELYSLFHGQEFTLPSLVTKEPAITNTIIVLEEFDYAINKLLDIEKIFKYKDVIKKEYLNMKNEEIKNRTHDLLEEYSSGHAYGRTDTRNIYSTNDMSIDMADMDYDKFKKMELANDGFDIQNSIVHNNAQKNVLKKRDFDNEICGINAELNAIIKSMDEDNKSNILRLSDMLELFQGPVPIKNRIIIATTNNFDKIRNELPALFRSGRMSPIQFDYLDWASLNDLSQYYFHKNLNIEPLPVRIPTSQIIELAIKNVLAGKPFECFESELLALLSQ